MNWSKWLSLVQHSVQTALNAVLWSGSQCVNASRLIDALTNHATKHSWKDGSDEVEQFSHTHPLITKVKSVGDFFQPITLLRSETRFQKPVIVGTWCQGLSPSLILAFPALNTEQLNKTSSICPSHSLTEPWQWLSGTVKKLRGLSETFLKSGSPLAHLLLGSIQGLLDPFREDSGSSLEVRAHLILRHRQLSRCLSLLPDCCALPPCDSTATSAVVGGGGATQCQNARAQPETSQLVLLRLVKEIRPFGNVPACFHLLKTRHVRVEKSTPAPAAR